MTPPVGYNQIVQMFGNPTQPGFEAKYVVPITLPYPLIFEDAVGVRHVLLKIRCHKFLAGEIQACFQEIKDNNLQGLCGYFGGCYNVRPVRGVKTKLSTHAWAIALDLNPATNPLGSIGDMDHQIIEIWEAHGFEWGGRWKRKDPQHFQFARGY